jgi:hypothetical protein
VIRQIRMLGLSVLAAFAVGVMLSASASAHTYVVCKSLGAGKGKYESHECKKEGGKDEWEWKEIAGAETFPVEVTSSTVKLEGEMFGGGVKTIMECRLAAKGELAAGGAGTGENTLSECQLYEVGKEHHKNALGAGLCSVGFSFDVTDKVITGQGSGAEVEFNSTAAEKTFAEFKISGASCALRGAYKLKETEVEILPAKQIVAGMVCALPEAAVGKVEHEVVCSSTGSHLTLGGAATSFANTETIKLSDGASWAVE